MIYDDGGSAFPHHPEAFSSHKGMTLRDYFAVHADMSLQVNDTSWAEQFVGSPFPDDILGQLKWQAELAAKCRYVLADAMLKARGE